MTLEAGQPDPPPTEFKKGLYAYLTRHTPDHVEVIGPDLRVLYLNHPAPGTTIKEVVGASILDLSPPEIRETLKSKLEHVFEQRETVRMEGSFDTPLGRRHYNTIIGPIIEGDRVVAAALIARDVTDLMTAQVQQANNSRLATIGELASGVGHEINNPLMALTGHLISVQDALDDAGIADADVHEKVRHCEDSVARIARIVRGLRRFSRASSDTDYFDVNRGIEETIEFLAGIFGFRQITFELEFVDTNLHCRGDSAVFQQVLTNILSNAKDAMQDVGNRKIIVRTRRHDHDVIIEVEDSGPGIQHAALPYVFDAFFTTKTNGTAAGMGLTLSRSIVESMAGSLEAENQGGGGARFRIRLPYKEVNLRPLRPELSWKDQKLERGRVLIVDDDETVLDAVSFLLEDLGFQVSSRSDPAEALRVIEEDAFDIVISDRQMPGMSGEVFVQQADQRLRKAGGRPSPRYFLLSGWHDPSYDDHAHVKLGDIDIGLIGKPVTRAELAAHLSIGSGLRARS